MFLEQVHEVIRPNVEALGAETIWARCSVIHVPLRIENEDGSGWWPEANDPRHITAMIMDTL